MSNEYLVQALRNYREVIYGQFDQEARYEIKLTQDAAIEIERLNLALAEQTAVANNYQQKYYNLVDKTK